jgi:hypothetical protein
MKWLIACFETTQRMTSNNRILALAVTASLFAAAPAAKATLAVAAPFEDKVENAAAIVLGKCVKTESRLDPSGRWIVTYSTFQIEKTMKGSAAGQITIVTPGGTVGTTRQSTVGIPDFGEGDENVLFVKNTPAGPTVLYFDQGTYEVTTDDRGEKIVAPVRSALVRIDSQRGVAVPAEAPKTLRAFEGSVSDAISERRQRRMRYEMVEAQRLKQASFTGTLLRYKWFVGIALLGAAIATWQLMRR